MASHRLDGKPAAPSRRGPGAGDKLVPEHGRFELELWLEGRRCDLREAPEFRQKLQGIEPLEIRTFRFREFDESLDLSARQVFLFRDIRNEEPCPLRIDPALYFAQNRIMRCLLDEPAPQRLRQPVPYVDHRLGEHTEADLLTGMGHGYLIVVFADAVAIGFEDATDADHPKRVQLGGAKSPHARGAENVHPERESVEYLFMPNGGNLLEDSVNDGDDSRATLHGQVDIARLRRW